MKLKSIKSTKAVSTKSISFKVDVLANVNKGMKALDAITEASKKHKREVAPSVEKHAGSFLYTYRKSVEAALDAGNEEVEKLVEEAGLNDVEVDAPGDGEASADTNVA